MFIRRTIQIFNAQREFILGGLVLAFMLFAYLGTPMAGIEAAAVKGDDPAFANERCSLVRADGTIHNGLCKNVCKGKVLYDDITGEYGAKYYCLESKKKGSTSISPTSDLEITGDQPLKITGKGKNNPKKTGSVLESPDLEATPVVETTETTDGSFTIFEATTVVETTETTAGSFTILEATLVTQ